MAKQKTIEIEADSLEEAQRQLRSQIPNSLYIHTERAISNGRSKIVKAVADTTEIAFTIAQKEIPVEASVIEKKILTSPEQRVVTVEAFDEQAASALIADKVRDTKEIIKAIKLKVIGNKGLFGVGKKPNQYEADVLRQANVEVTYSTKAKISAELGDKTNEINIEILGNKLDEIKTTPLYRFCDLFGNVMVTSDKIPIFAEAKISKPPTNQAVSKIEDSYYDPKEPFSLLFEFFPDLLQEIFDEQFKMGTQNTISGSALHRLLFKGKFSAAEILIEKEANPNIKNSDGKTPLHLCVDDSIVDAKKCIKLLIEHGADVNATDTNGDTPLHFAISNCDYFIERAHNVGMGYLIDEHLKAVEILIEHGADINIKNKKGLTPFSNIKTPEILGLFNKYSDALDLHTASSVGMYDKVIELLNSGSDVNLIDGEGKTPLYRAIDNQQSSVVKALLDHGADPNIGEERPPIYLATEKRQISMIKALLEHGANPNIQVQQPMGWTPLHFAAWENLGEIALILVEHGADRLIREAARKMTPLEVAYERRSSAVINILK